MGSNLRKDFTQEKAAAAYSYLGLTREQLLDKLVEMSVALDKDVLAAYPGHGGPNPNRVLGIPSAISPKAYYPFTEYVDLLVFQFVRAEAKSRSLSILAETKNSKQYRSKLLYSCD